MPQGPSMITPTPGTPAPAPAPAEEGPPPEACRCRRRRGGRGSASAAASRSSDCPRTSCTRQFGYRVQAGPASSASSASRRCFSKSLQSVSRKTLLWGIGLQFVLAVAVIHSRQVQAVFEVGRRRASRHSITASDKGAEFVFGSLAQGGRAGRVRLRLQGAAADHLRVVVLQRALLLRRAAILRAGSWPG